jgi:hypothetical protein
MQTQPKERRPAPSAEAVALRLAIQATKSLKVRQRVRRLRERAEAEIERLLAFMDATDGYTIFEYEEGADDVPCDDSELEPSLGWTSIEARSGRIASSADVDVEGDAREDDEDNSDAEPSLGWTRGGAIGNGLDLEEALHG